MWLGEAEGDHAVLFHLQHHVLTPHWCDSALPRCLARYAWAPSMASRNSCSPLESVATQGSPSAHHATAWLCWAIFPRAGAERGPVARRSGGREAGERPASWRLAFIELSPIGRDARRMLALRRALAERFR